MTAQWPSTLTPSRSGKPEAAAGRLAVADVGEVVADLAGVKVVVAGDRLQRAVGEHRGDELAERGVERRAAARGVGEDRAAAGLEVPAEPVLVVGAEGEAGPAVEVDQREVHEVRVGRQQARGGRSRRRAPTGRGAPSSGAGTAIGATFQSPACLSLAMCKRPALGRLAAVRRRPRAARACRPAARGRWRTRPRSGRPASAATTDGSPGSFSDLVPVAREVVGRVDDDGPAAVARSPRAGGRRA